jgi:predicted transcriptional regulator
MFAYRISMSILTIRQDADQHAELEAVAQVEGVPVSHIVRDAIAESLHKRRNDPEFRDRLRQHLEDNRRILERLADQ